MALFSSKADREKFKADLDAHETEISSLTAERDRLAGEVQSLTAERDALQGKVADLTGQMSALTRERDAATARAEASAKAEKEAKDALEAEQKAMPDRIAEEVNKGVAAGLAEAGLPKEKTPPAAGTGKPDAQKPRHPADAIAAHWSAESQALMGIN